MGLENSSTITRFLSNFVHKKNLEHFLENDSNSKTRIEYYHYNEYQFPLFVNEFWTSKQRQACSLHEISYRACFKAQLPRFFIKLLTKTNDTVYDPFSGRGTTVIEAGLLGRNIISNDINPLSKILAKPRFFPPSINEIKERLNEIDFSYELKADIDLSMFYQTRTESEIVSLREYFLTKERLDHIDEWIRMIATNRLTGHSKGFFSVYTLPPNQAVSQKSQIRINIKRNQTPEYRNVKALILKKSKSLLRNVTLEQKTTLKKIGTRAIFLSDDARNTKTINTETVELIVTSPPFLNVVQYSKDNWLRCWFNGINPKEIERKITIPRRLDDWTKVMKEAFIEFYRIMKPKGWVAFEVGEIRGGRVKLEEHIIPIGLEAGFKCEGVVINTQLFTKTANIWGINNNRKGTNTNRIVLFQKR